MYFDILDTRQKCEREIELLTTVCHHHSLQLLPKLHHGFRNLQMESKKVFQNQK